MSNTKCQNTEHSRSIITTNTPAAGKSLGEALLLGRISFIVGGNYLPPPIYRCGDDEKEEIKKRKLRILKRKREMRKSNFRFPPSTPFMKDSKTDSRGRTCMRSPVGECKTMGKSRAFKTTIGKEKKCKSQHFN